VSRFPKISIITPSFNQAEFIEQTIESVLSQNYPDLEYIIIDGGSTDRSVDIIKKYSPHLTYWVSEKDRGQSHAINKGLARVTGNVVNWLNSDDYYEPGVLQRIGAAFSDPSATVVCARGNIVQDQSFVKESSGTDIYRDNLHKTIGWARIDQPETFFRKSVYDSLGMINERYHFVMDKEFWVRYLMHFGLSGIRQLNDIVVNFRFHDKSKTQSQKEKFSTETIYLFYNLAIAFGATEEAGVLADLLPAGDKLIQSTFPSVPREMVRCSLHYFLLLKADEFYYQGNYQAARKILTAIDPRVLAPEDVSRLNKISFRSRYVPHFLIKLLRR
jgi:glycosyltransferase involved in cell wall biosynthesis